MRGKKPKVENNKNELIRIDSLLDTSDEIDINSDNFNKIMFIYSVGIKELQTKIEIMKDEFKIFYDYDLIDHVQTRIKSIDSIKKKMEDRGLKFTYKEMIQYVNDIAGVRIICPMQKDIFSIRNLIEELPGIRILKEKDYVTNPKKSGYSSYHLVLEVPIVLSQKKLYVKVEVQIRTMAMDFWASLEHRIKYKSNKQLTKAESKDLITYAKMVRKLDNKMMLIHERN